MAGLGCTSDVDTDAAPDGGPNKPGECNNDGVTAVGVSVTADVPDAIDDALVKAGTGGRFDKFSLGAGVLNRPCTVCVCAACEGSGTDVVVFVSDLGLVSRRVGEEFDEDVVDMLVVASFISISSESSRGRVFSIFSSANAA